MLRNRAVFPGVRIGRIFFVALGECILFSNYCGIFE